ncbi:hypothetical protein [Hyphococcus sp.]|uniref:hypothetical protein n=1 Tax=Hyphococcus sp. TaxID=2038636 RepID=UPI003753DA7E
MSSGPLRIALFALLSLTLSAGHSVCASLITPAINVSANAHHAQSHAGDGSRTHANHASGHESGLIGDHHSAPCGPDSNDCQHCQAVQFFKTAVQADFAVSMVTASFSKAIVADAASMTAFRRSAQTSVKAYRWRGPPAKTPVSLKIRLRN